MSNITLGGNNHNIVFRYQNNNRRNIIDKFIDLQANKFFVIFIIHFFSLNKQFIIFIFKFIIFWRNNIWINNYHLIFFQTLFNYISLLVLVLILYFWMHVKLEILLNYQYIFIILDKINYFILINAVYPIIYWFTDIK